MFRLNLRWNDGELELQAPDTGEILLDRRGAHLAMEAAERRQEDALREVEEYREMVREQSQPPE